MTISVDKLKEFDEMLASYKDAKGSLMPMLQKTQDMFGYLPKEILERMSKKTQIPIAKIYGVASFYAQFTFIPTGKYKISVCMGTACYVKGAEEILKSFEKKLNISLGQTTDDQMFSLIETRCVGDCSLSPLVVVNDKRYPHFKLKDVDGLVEELKGEN